MTVQIVRTVPDWQNAILVKANDKHFIIISVDSVYASETLAFPCDENGENVDFIEVAGVRNPNAFASVMHQLSNKI